MNLNPSSNSKPELRREIRRRKAACSPEQLQQLSAEVTRKLLSNPRWQQSQTLLLYHSLPDEVSTSALIQSAVEQGKRVLLPVVVGDDLELREYVKAICEPILNKCLVDLYKEMKAKEKEGEDGNEA